ncbi:MULTISPECIES: AraC family transcriptional regulator [Cupriavidus]
MTDLLSEILKLADAQPAVAGGFSAGGAWAIRFPQPDKLKFFALLKGRCWLRVDGTAEPVRAEQGDVLLLSGQRGFVLASDLDLAPLDAATLFGGSINKTARLGEGDDCVQIGGHVRLDPVNGAWLAEALPPLIHIRAVAPQAAVLQWLLDQMVRELAAERPGNRLASAYLAQLMFVQMLRLHLDTAEHLAGGWLRAIGDRRLAPVLQLMHGEPGRAWRLEELAGAAAMSRTAFAIHFKAVAGTAPLTWLTEWRMRLARRALRDESTPIAVLAARFGYASESAFSNAFKRVTGDSPRHYRRAGPPD